MKWVEVRCCCEPAKLLGHVQVPNDFELRVGNRLKFVAFERLAPVLNKAYLVNPTSTTTVELEIGDVQFYPIPAGRWTPEHHFAFKSNDTPLEKLRKIPSWREANVVELF